MKGDLEDIEVYSSFTGGFSWDAKEAEDFLPIFSCNREGTDECFLIFVLEESEECLLISIFLFPI